jgi:hypothetical protein
VGGDAIGPQDPATPEDLTPLHCAYHAHSGVLGDPHCACATPVQELGLIVTDALFGLTHPAVSVEIVVSIEQETVPAVVLVTAFGVQENSAFKPFHRTNVQVPCVKEAVTLRIVVTVAAQDKVNDWPLRTVVGAVALLTQTVQFGSPL